MRTQLQHGSAVLAVVIVALLLTVYTTPHLGVNATSCGEPRLSASDTCSDEQCSRILSISSTSSTSDRVFSAEGGVVASTNNGSSPSDDYFGYGVCIRGLPVGSPCDTNNDCFIVELTCTNKTCTTKADTKNAGIGYLGVVVAVLGFGSFFIPVKKVRRTGNGILFQLIMGTAIMMVGIVVALITKRYTFYPMSMVGGMCWAIGNAISVPAVQLIGMGLSVSSWGITNMIFGWASGKFGLMGVKAEPVPNINWLSYVGISLALVSIASFAAVKPSPKPTDTDDDEDNETTNTKKNLLKRTLSSSKKRQKSREEAEDGEEGKKLELNSEGEVEPLLLSKYSDDLGGSIVSSTKSLARKRSQTSPATAVPRHPSYTNDENVIIAIGGAGIQSIEESNAAATASNARTELFRRVLGFILALVAGIFYGINFNPSQSMMDYASQKTLDDPTATPSVHFSPNGLDYVFSSFIGIFVSAVGMTVIFYGVHIYIPEHLVRKYVPTLFADTFTPPPRISVDPTTGLHSFYFSDFEDMLLPALASGFVWSLAQIGWFVANTDIGMTMSFPLVCLGPSVVANIWGILLFREIQGRRNFIFLGVGFLFVSISCFCTVFAKNG